MNKRVLVCGGRTFCNWCLLADTLKAHKPAVVISGMANGADKMAMNWAHLNGVQFDGYPAKWATKLGVDRGAGPKRNQRMLDEGKPDLVIAFPGGAGTADMVKRARKAGVPVLEVKLNEDLI